VINNLADPFVAAVLTALLTPQVAQEKLDTLWSTSPLILFIGKFLHVYLDSKRLGFLNYKRITGSTYDKGKNQIFLHS